MEESLENGKRIPSKNAKDFKLINFVETFPKACFGMLFNGVLPSHNSRAMSVWRATNVVMVAIGLALLVNSTKEALLLKDYTDATRQMAILFLLINMSIKMSCLIRHKDSMNSIIVRIDEDYRKANEQLTDEEADIVKEYAMAGVMLQNVWTYLALFVGSVFPVSAIVMMLYSNFTDPVIKKQMVFYAILPLWDDQKFDTPLYELFFVFEIFLCYGSTLLYIGFDPLVPIASLHMCGQMDLIKIRLSKLFNGKPISSPNETKVQLSGIIVDLQNIYEFSADLCDTASYVYEAIFSFTPIMSTVAAFQTFSMLKDGKIPYEFTFFFIATIVHIFIPSYYGNLFLDKSVSVGDAVYQCGWEGSTDLSARSTLLMMLMRSQKPLQLSTMFKPVSLMLFSEVLQQSWTIFNLLRVMFE